MIYGPITIDRHRFLKSQGIDLHVFIRGEDMTNRCRFVDDTPGQEVALLFRKNIHGHCYRDEDGEVSMELAHEDIVIKPV